MGENFREYITNEEMLPIVILPKRNKIAPNILIKDSERLLTKLTDGPMILPS